MQETVQSLLRHGYLVLVVWVLAEQIGLPFPLMPILLAAGVLAGLRRMNVELVLALPIAAALYVLLRAVSPTGAGGLSGGSGPGRDGNAAVSRFVTQRKSFRAAPKG